MKRHFLNARARGRRVTLAGWGFVVGAFCVGAGTVGLHSRTGAEVLSQAAPSPRAASEPAKRLYSAWYFRSGQCRADLHTLAATVRFLLEPENGFSDPAPATVSTNHAAVPPPKGTERWR